MKISKYKFLIAILSMTLFSCDEDEVLSESRDLLEFEILLINNNFDVCNSISLTYLIDEEGVQTSYDVVSGSSKTVHLNVRRGEFIGVTAFDTNDNTNKVLAFANIDSSHYSKDKENRLRVYYTECPVIDKILWVTF
ncbi:hypothetical protein [Algibacter sp. 2305UL17-15]|uniref:hypothetical protein n=1 Tax=Algibacter sp. 2305UL17-15 TaxID=3231268 RepID=UPI00345B1BCA